MQTREIDRLNILNLNLRTVEVIKRHISNIMHVSSYSRNYSVFLGVRTPVCMTRLWPNGNMSADQIAVDASSS